MTVKICSTCKIEKSTSDYYPDKRKKDGLNSSCKSCESNRKKIARVKDPEKFRERWKKYKQANNEKVRLKNERYKKSNHDAILENRRIYREKTREHQRELGRLLYEKNKQKRMAEAREFSKRNREQLEVKRKRQRESNPEKYRAQTAVTNAVSIGKLARVGTLKCVVCEEKASHYHHHLGYEEEHKLDVIPLCAKCHKGVHVGLISLERG